MDNGLFLSQYYALKRGENMVAQLYLAIFFIEKPFFQRGSSLLFPFQNFISKILKEKTAIGQIYK